MVNIFRLFDIEANAMIKCRDSICFEDILGHEKFKKGAISVEKNILGELLEDESDDENDPIIEIVQPDKEHHHALTAKLQALIFGIQRVK